MREKLVENWVSFLGKLPSLFLGLFLFAAGLVANLNSGLGMSPWGVLTIGLTNHVSLTFGQVSQLVGLVVLAIGWILGFSPGMGTLANMYFIGLFIDLIIAWGLMPVPNGLVLQFAMLSVSIVLIGVGSYFYMWVRLGTGPRDGLMMGFVRRLDYPVAAVRGTLEVTVLAIGWLLGGPVGVGTVINAFTLGLSVQTAFRLGGYDKNVEHTNLLKLFGYLSGKGSMP
ncbi:MAG: membrane protein [Candidatus Bathyarchaeota archaeon]|nr:membrane protein [Candidatus Bathyarchaeota archaeon]